jgi:hypothetical protein
LTYETQVHVKLVLFLTFDSTTLTKTSNITRVSDIGGWEKLINARIRVFSSEPRILINQIILKNDGISTWSDIHRIRQRVSPSGKYNAKECMAGSRILTFILPPSIFKHDIKRRVVFVSV